MTTVAQLATEQYQGIGYVLFIEGWPIAFTNRIELTGSGVGSWIGTSEGARTVALGLEPPATIKHAIGIVESGLPLEGTTTFTLIDRDNYLIQFAKDETGTAVYERLAPTDDPAPATLIDGGGNPVTLHDRWINGESIGPEGQRRQFQVIPGSPFPPYDHASIDGDVQDLRASTVRTAPRFLEGLLCALYLIRQDPVTGTWPSWQDQYDSGSSLWWLGSVRSLAAESAAWKLEADGWLSLLRKTLNANRPAAWQPLRPLVDFGPGENKIAVAFCYSTHQAQRQIAASSAYTVSDTITSGQTAADLAFEINTRLQTIAGTAGPDVTFSTWYSGAVSLTDEQFTISVADNNGGNAYGGVMALRMHKSAWLALGWDLTLQVEPWDQVSTVYEVEGKAGNETEFHPVWLNATPDPAPGYWEALFTTCPIGQVWNSSPLTVDGDGATQVYKPLYSDPPEILHSEGGQRLDFGFFPPYIEGQLARPPADKVLDSGTCDATAFFAVRGTFKGSMDGDEETRYQVFKGSWKASTVGTTIALDPNSKALVWLEQWLDPEHFGAPNKKLDYTWAANDLEYVPIALLGHNTNAPDTAYAVLLRLLLGSGTAGPWTGYEGDPAATITPGVNAHPDATNLADDLEVADLGLAIPHTLIDWQSFVTAAEALPPGGVGSPLNKCRLAYIGPFDSQQCIEDIIRPRGWCFSLRNGKLGLFARSAPLDVADVEVAITQSDIAGTPDETPPGDSADFRTLEPIDLIEVTYGGNQLDGGADENSATIKARDPRAAMRRGNAKVEIDGRSLLPDGSWLVDFNRLWGDQLARWYAEPWTTVRVKVKGDKARNIWPGTIVSYTSPWLATRTGTYGMTGIGRVISVERDLQTLAATLEIMLQPSDGSTPRRFAPIARLLDDVATVEDRHNAASRTLYCYRDAFSRGGTVSDVAAFAEPAWLGVGGDALAYVWSSWDGVTWEKTAELEIESVNTAAHSITYKTGSLSPTDGIWERRFTVVTMAPYEDQDTSSWPTALFGVHAGSDLKFGASDEDGFPWIL